MGIKRKIGIGRGRGRKKLVAGGRLRIAYGRGSTLLDRFPDHFF